MNTGGANEMTRAAGIVSEALRLVPCGPWHCTPLGARQYPQRITSSRGSLIAECYETAGTGVHIGPYLALLSPGVLIPVADGLARKGAEWDETVEWKDGFYFHVGGCGGTVGHDSRGDGCECFRDALVTARAVLAQAAAGERSQ